MTKKYVLTGGPCTGKSTMLQLLGSLGYQIIPEAARIIIEDQQLKEGKNLPWINRNKFQKTVLKKQVLFENNLKKNKSTFLDRGIPDGLAYYKLDNLPAPKELVEESKKRRYEIIFLLKRLPHYQTDLSRKEDKKTGEKIHRLLKQTYLELGYKVIEVPALTVEKRTEFILQKINNQTKTKKIT